MERTTALGTSLAPPEVAAHPEYRRMLSGGYFNSLAPVLASAQRVALDRVHAFGSIKRSAHGSLDEYLRARQAALERVFGAIGPNSLVENGLKVDFGFNTAIGANFRSGPNLVILDCNVVEIGSGCVFGSSVTIIATGHPVEVALRRNKDTVIFALPVRIGDRVVIGDRAVIMQGIEIGDDVVVEPGAVVTKSLPSGTWGGVPARRRMG